MASNPFDQFDTTPQTGPVYGLPKTPEAQTPDQAQGVKLQNAHTGLENQSIPLQNENTRVNIAQGQTSIQNQHFNQNQGLRQEYNNLPEVKNYSVALQSLGTALKAPDTPQGDLSVIYAYAKAADPGSVVREGEMDMATATASLPQKLQVELAKVNQGKRLPPQVRQGLIETMRQSVGGLRQVYDQQRGRYSSLAQQNGFDPNEIVGQPLYDAYRPLEEAYIRAHGQTPVDPNAPQQEAPPAPTQTEKGFGLHASGSTPTASSEDFRQSLFGAMHSKQLKSTADIQNWVDQYNQSHQTGWMVDLKNPDTRRALAAALSGKRFNVQQPTPNIGDVRGGDNTDTQDQFNSGVRGIVDTASLGVVDKGVAAADTLFKGGPMDYNLQRQYSISDFDQAQHPYARLGGQVLGGSVLPMGDVNSLGNLALKGAGYGTAYGVASSRSLSDVPVNALAGGVVGAAVPAALGRFIKPKPNMGVDPLVDPVTGELNQPMVDSMNPAQRGAVMHDYGMKTLTPGMVGGRTARVLEQGLNNVPGSAGVMEDVNAQASGELRRSMQGVAQQFGSSKTLAEGGAQLQRGTKEWMGRADTLASKLYDAIPIARQSTATVDGTRAKLRDLLDIFTSNPKMQQLFQNSRLKAYLDALTPEQIKTEFKLGPGRISFRGPADVPIGTIRDEGGTLSWEDLKHFRSILGEDLGEQRLSGDSPYKSQLRGLYGALSDDMRATAQAQGPGALKAFERANGFYQRKETVIEDSLTRILGADAKTSPEKAAAAVQAMTHGGKAGGDIKTLAQIKAATVKSGAWDEIASTLIHLGGQPAKSEGRAFSPQTFVQWYADMSEPARAMLFKPELRKSLDGFVAMNQQLSRIKGLANTSNTTPTMIGSGVIAAGGLAAVTHPTALIGLVAAGGANYGMAKLWTNPAFVKLMTGLGRASLTANPNAVSSQVGRLAKFAATNPEFSEPVQLILRQIANDNAPKIGSAVASPNGGPDQQQQPQR